MADFFDSELNIPQTTCSIASMNMAIDIGSTQTRICQYLLEGTIFKHQLLDSNYEIVTRDISHVSSPSENVIDNLDMVITDKTAEHKVKPMITTEHVVKGGLLQKMTINVNITSASTSKIDQKATYINIISNIALLFLKEYSTRGLNVKKPSAVLTVSLPPEDTKHQARLDTFRNTLAGEYEVDFIRLGVKVPFTINESDILVISEPEAVAVYKTVSDNSNSDEDNSDVDDSVICVLDVGGRSTGITFIVDGHLLVDSCATVNLGGACLAALFSRNIAAEYSIQEPLITRVSKSLETGTYRLGAQRVDVSAQLNAAKQEFAAMICNELIRAVDNNGLQLQNISTILCSGRTFGDAPKSPSLMTFIEKEFKEKSSFTEFSLVDIANPILTGLCYRGIYNG